MWAAVNSRDAVANVVGKSLKNGSALGAHTHTQTHTRDNMESEMCLALRRNALKMHGKPAERVKKKKEENMKNKKIICIKNRRRSNRNELKAEQSRN